MTITELAPAGGEAISLAEAKAFLRVEDGAEDQLILSLIRTARDHLERETGVVTLTRPFRLYLDDWPAKKTLEIGRFPVTSIEAVTLHDAAGLPVAVNLSGFVLAGRALPPRLFLPSRPAPLREMSGIEIDFTAGFGETGAEVPDGLRRAMLTHVAAMYELRGGIDAGDQPAIVPPGYDRLVAPYRIRRL